MKRILGALLSMALGLCLAAPKPARPPLFEEVDGICRELEAITGLKFVRPVPQSVIGKKQLKKFLAQRIDKATNPADLKAESLTLKMLGLVPEDFDLRQETVDLMTEQAAAFYDYQKKRLFLIEDEHGEAAVMALAHELAHALADQHYPLRRYVNENGNSDDAATARMAVMEGQATWLMGAYMHVRAGLGREVPEAILKMMSETTEQSAAEYPVFSKSPLYVRESLVFPYKAGMLFQDAVYRKLGKRAFFEVFQRAPVSTQQVMHPEKYLDRVAPVLPRIPHLPEEKRFRKLAEGTLGEFDFSVMLRQYNDGESADSLLRAFRGSQFALFENKREKYPALVFSVKWATPADAEVFLAAYRKVMEEKSKVSGLQAEENRLTGRNQHGFFRVTASGDTVESLEGLKYSLH